MYISDILRNKRVQFALVSIVSAAGGAVGGYFVGKKKARIHVHINRTKSIFDEELPPQVVTTTETVTTTVEEFEIIGDGSGDVVAINVIRDEDADWDMEAELATRGDGTKPYIIHQEEFINDEMDFHQSTVTYYEGDDIMADTDDTVIYNYQGMMGPLRFGHGSKDPTVVYIRNETIMQEWEVIYNAGYYSIEVTGLAMEKQAEKDLKHSVQKFRQE